MLAYDMWRYSKIMAQLSGQKVEAQENAELSGVMNNTIRIARLKLLHIAAKLVFDDNRDNANISATNR